MMEWRIHNKMAQFLQKWCMLQLSQVIFFSLSSNPNSKNINHRWDRYRLAVRRRQSSLSTVSPLIKILKQVWHRTIMIRIKGTTVFVKKSEVVNSRTLTQLCVNLCRGSRTHQTKVILTTLLNPLSNSLGLCWILPLKIYQENLCLKRIQTQTKTKTLVKLQVHF